MNNILTNECDSIRVNCGNNAYCICCAVVGDAMEKKRKEPQQNEVLLWSLARCLLFGRGIVNYKRIHTKQRVLN